MKRHYLLLWVLVSACGKDSARTSAVHAVRDNFYVGFHENSFSVPEDEHPKIPGSTLSYMLMTNPEGESRAYAIDCRGKNVADVARAFGADPSNPFLDDKSYETLEQEYKISEQPILRCSNVRPSGENRSINTVFRLMDDRPAEKIKEKPLPQIFVRFNNVTADDATDEEQLYSVGCHEILDAFGTDAQKFILGESTPILASSAARIFPGFENSRPLNCMTNTSPPTFFPGLNLVLSLPVTTTYDLTQKLEFYRVVDAGNSARTLSYLLVQGKDANRIDCPNVNDFEIHRALNFPSNYSTQTLKSDEAIYLNSLNRPAIECVNVQTSERFESRWSTVREIPAVNFYKKRDSRTLFRFGCASAESYFTKGLKLTGGNLQVTPDQMRYLAEAPAAGYQVVTFPCYGSGLTVDPDALTSGEVISLKMPSATADKAWLEGNSVNGVIAQRNQKNSGGHWLVTSTGANANFTIQSLGRNPGVTYLACPASGNTPKLVQLANDPEHNTEWTMFRGNGSGAARLGCRDADGQLKLLNGGGGALTTVSDESTGTDASTNWLIEHQTFVEDPNFLIPGKIVSFYSVTTAGKHWIAAYPGKPQEAGLEEKATSPATYFVVEKRSDNRGVSLKSLNKGTGHFYLECNFPLKGLQLAPSPMGATGTAFKAYKLTNSIHTLFKLGCFDSNTDSTYWVAPNGRSGPPLIESDDASMNSIFYLQPRDAGPTF